MTPDAVRRLRRDRLDCWPRTRARVVRVAMQATWCRSAARVLDVVRRRVVLTAVEREGLERRWREADELAS